MFTWSDVSASFLLVALASEEHANTGLYIRSSAGLATRDKRIERLVRRIFYVLPDLTTADRPTVQAWAQIEYLADQVYAELRRNGVFTREMESRRLLDDFKKIAHGKEEKMSVYPRIFVTSIDYTADDTDVYKFLSGFVSGLLSFKLVRDSNGYSRGFGFAEVETQEEANTLLELDDSGFMGRRIAVAPAKDKQRGNHD